MNTYSLGVGKTKLVNMYSLRNNLWFIHPAHCFGAPIAKPHSRHLEYHLPLEKDNNKD